MAGIFSARLRHFILSGQFLEKETGFAQSQSDEIHKGRKHGHQVPSLGLEIPCIGIIDAQEDGDRAARTIQPLKKKRRFLILPGQIQSAACRYHTDQKADNENPIIGLINIVVCRQAHGTEHGHKASGKQGEIIRPEYHGKDTNSLILIGLP